MALTNKTPFDKNISSRKLNKELDFVFDRGWSPVLVPVIDGYNVYLKLTKWIGGEGEMPFDPTLDTYYLGQNDFVTDENNAINIAEHLLSDTYLEGILDISTISITLKRESGGIYADLYFKTADYQPHDVKVLLFTDNIITDNERFNILNTPMYGATRRAISETLHELKNWLIINDYLENYPNYSEEKALSHRAVMAAIDAAKAKFDVPIFDLTTFKIEQIENENGVTDLNPYYMIVAEDNRVGGYHTDTCTITCVQQCCDLNSDGGYEERGNRDGITGCRCTPEVPEVLATCRVVITSLGNTDDRYELWLNNEILSFYTVNTGDTINDVINGLIANLATSCGSGDQTCDVQNITNNSFDLTALVGSGSTPNSYTKDVVVTGNAGMTFTQIVQGVDYVPETYRGVRHHLIAYDGTMWYDFGPTLAFGNNNEDAESCICTFISQTDTPESYENYAGYVPIVNDTEDGLIFKNFTFLNLNDTPNTYTANSRLKVNGTGDSIIEVDDSFLNLNDVRDTNYTNKENYVPVVNNTEDKLELKDPQDLVNNTFIGLTDTPNTYNNFMSIRSEPYGQGVYKKSTEDGLEFIDTPMRRVKNGETINGNIVTLNYDSDVLRPQHFQFVDDKEDTTNWGEEHAGRMKFEYSTTYPSYWSLQVWAPDGSRIWGWRVVKSENFV